jgi:tetratricopeptide (TPR) repeat protein
MTIKADLKQLRIWREEANSGMWLSTRNHEKDMYQKVYQLASPLIHHHTISCATELYVLCEQYIWSCLMLEKPEDGMVALQILSQKFGERSPRVGKLWGMTLEAQGRFEEALKLYDELLQNDPINASIIKRKIAMLKSQHRLPEAITQLVAYVDIFMTDTEAWIELCELYRQTDQ